MNSLEPIASFAHLKHLASTNFHELFVILKHFTSPWPFANFRAFTTFVAFEILDAIEALEAPGMLKTLEASEILQAFETFGTC